MPRRYSPGDQRLVTLEINETDVRSVTDQDISITALQRRTGNDAVPAATTHLVNPGCDRVKPGPAILIGQRNTLMHLVNIGCGMKPIGIRELPMQTLGQQRSHCRLSGS